METISKIADFCDPRRTYLDYYYRNRTVITELSTIDFRSEHALDLISSIEGHDIRADGYDKATWYTTIPVPYNSAWTNILSKHLPD